MSMNMTLLDPDHVGFAKDSTGDVTGCSLLFPPLPGDER